MGGDGEVHGRGWRGTWEGMERYMGGDGEVHGRGWRGTWEGWPPAHNQPTTNPPPAHHQPVCMCMCVVAIKQLILLKL